MKRILVFVLGLFMVGSCLVVSISCVTQPAGPTFPQALQSAFPTYTPCGYPGATCTPTPPPPLCIATPIFRATPVSGDTSLSPDLINSSCGYTGSPDQVYSFNLGLSTTVTITTCSLNTTYDNLIMLLNSCSPPNLIGCDVHDSACGSATAGTIIMSLTPGTYYVVVSGHFSSDSGAYQLIYNY